MKKQKTIATSIGFSLLAVLFLAGCNGKNQNGSATTAPAKITVPATSAGDKNSSSSEQLKSSGDADIDAIDKDLNSINDEDFGDSSLSDSEVGL